MAKILIDLNCLGKNNQVAIQGIKLFLNKNKNSELIVLANIDDCLTIKDYKQVKIYDINDYKNKIDDCYRKITDPSLRVAMYLLNKSDEDIMGLVTYSKKTIIAEAAKNFLHKEVDSPIIIATFANYKTHRVTCIGDLGYNSNPSMKDYRNYLSLMTSYMKKTFKIEKPEFKVLAFDKDIDNELDKAFKKENNYKGIVEGRELFKCNCDIVIGNPHEFLGIISGIDHGISIYDEFMKEQVRKNVGIRYFVYPMFKSVLTNFHMEIDQKLTSGGNVLLGFKKNIVVIDPNTIKQGVKVSLNLINQLETLS